MNQFFIGALDLSAYIKICDIGNPHAWQVCCWNVPEAYFGGLCCEPVLKVPVFLRFQTVENPFAFYSGFPNNTVAARFLFLKHAPYTELNFMFQSDYGRFGFHIKTRLYIALDNKGLFDE